jgi:hypothetical protein
MSSDYDKELHNKYNKPARKKIITYLRKEYGDKALFALQVERRPYWLKSSSNWPSRYEPLRIPHRRFTTMNKLGFLFVVRHDMKRALYVSYRQIKKYATIVTADTIRRKDDKFVTLPPEGIRKYVDL